MTEEQRELKKRAYKEIAYISDSVKAKMLETLKALPMRGDELKEFIQGDEDKKLCLGWFAVDKPTLPGIFKDESSMVSIRISSLGEAVKRALEEKLEKLPERKAETQAILRSLYSLLNYLADSPYPIRITDLPQDCIDICDTAIRFNWVKKHILPSVDDCLLMLTPEGEAEIARYHRVSSAFYDMNLSEKVKC